MTDTVAADRYRDVREKIAKARADAREAAKNLFAEGAKTLFEKYPELEGFTWNQYTPYFNDGDACEFGVNSYSLYTWGGRDAKSPDDDEYEMYEEEEYYYGETKDTPLALRWTDIRDFIEAFDEGDMKELFGDHKTVKVYRTGEVKTDFYEHD